MILSFLKFIPTKPTHLDSRTNCPIQIRTPSSIIPQNQNKNKKKKKMSKQNYHEQTRVLYELCSMTTHLLRSPPFSITFPGGVRSLITSSQASSSSSPPPPQISPAALGSLFVGASIALMLFGSVVFVIGLVMMPLVITLVLLFYVAEIVSGLSEIGRAVLWADHRF